MLELRDLVKHYRSGSETVRAIDGISLKIDPRETVALYGPSGSGKSTLLMLIAALLAPDSGSVLVDGRDISALSGRDAARYRRLQMGFVRQELDLLPGFTAVDNAAVKLLDSRTNWKAARRRVTPLLVQLGLAGRLQHRPEELSKGESQRVLIARALSTEPRLVLADEPTGSLDTRRSRETLELLTSVCQQHGVAMLIATHDPQAAAYATRVHMLRDGALHDYEPDRAALAASGRR
jgi:putative ABC transport system ATP-binding protein